MSTNQNPIPLKGSNKHLIPNSRVIGEAPPGEFQVTVMVRRKAELPAAGAHIAHKVGDRTYLTRDQHTTRYGAEAADLQKVEAFAHQNGLRVTATSTALRSVTLMGSPSAYSKAFGVELKMYESADKTYRGREGDIYLPPSLEGIVTSVTGLDNRQFAKPHFRIHRGAAQAVGAGASAHASARASSVPPGFSPLDLAALYNFPSSLDGTGQTIAILELGGGFRSSELATYYKSVGVTNPPTVTAAPFTNGGANSPGTNALDPNNSDVEVMLDIEVAGSIAPGAKIFVYFAPDATDQSFLNVMNAIVHDSVNNPGIVSISWGGPEESATTQFQNEFDQILQAASQMGITVCVAAGDDASADFAANDPNWDKKAHVDFPAASPFALACGGTNLTASNGAIASEVVWHDGPNDGTGGGISRAFPLPTYQDKAGVPKAVDPAGPVMRGVPDVAGDAAPATGYRVLCDGTSFPDASQGLPPVGGTSAVAPLWAGLVARLNQGLGKPVGFLNPLIYSLPASAGAFNDITQGNNGNYKAKSGWDPCTGLGSPNGQNLLNALK
jgi:kumamolisin